MHLSTPTFVTPAFVLEACNSVNLPAYDSRILKQFLPQHQLQPNLKKKKIREALLSGVVLRYFSRNPYPTFSIFVSIL